MILITRPKADAGNMQEVLSKKGWQSLLEPMLMLETLFPKIPAAKFYITTSANAEKFVPVGKIHLNIPEHGKTAAELLAYIKTNFSASEGKFLYLRGEDITLDIKAELTELGFDADEVTVYKTTKPEAFSPEFLDKVYQIQIATFFSSQSLENFLELVRTHNLKEAIKGIKLLALSEKIANVAGKYDFKGIYWSELPNQQSLIEKLEEIL